jgi:hypothetical protein
VGQPLRNFAGVALEQTAESLMALNVTQPNHFGRLLYLRTFRLVPLRFRWLLDQLVVQALMRTFPVIMIPEFLAENVHCLLDY